MSNRLGERRSTVPGGSERNGDTSVPGGSTAAGGSSSSATGRCWAGPGCGRRTSSPGPAWRPARGPAPGGRRSRCPRRAPVRRCARRRRSPRSSPRRLLAGRSCTRRRSSLTTSGRSSGMNARDIASAPTSSRARPQPISRIRCTVCSSSAGRAAMARSVISTTTRSWLGADSAMASRSASGALSSTSGSTLTKTVSGASSPCSTARGRRRHGRRRPARRAGGRAGGGEQLDRGPQRALRPAGQGLVGDDGALSRSTMGWNTLVTASAARTSWMVVMVDPVRTGPSRGPQRLETGRRTHRVIDPGGRAHTPPVPDHPDGGVSRPGR